MKVCLCTSLFFLVALSGPARPGEAPRTDASLPAHLEEKLRRGKELLGQKQFRKAAAVFRNLEQQKDAAPRLDEVYYLLSKVYAKMGKDVLARRYAQSVREQFPSSGFYCKASQQYCASFRQERETYRTCLEEMSSSCNDPIVILNTYQQLMFLYQEKRSYKDCVRMADAILVYDQTLAREKERVAPVSLDTVYYIRGESNYHLGAYQDAIQDYTRAVSETSDAGLQDKIYEGIGWSYHALEQPDIAQTWFSKIQSEAERRYAQARWLLLHKQYPAALQAFQDLRQTDQPKTVYGKALLGEADCLYQMQRYKDALAVYLKALTATAGTDNDSYERALYGVGWCYLKDGRFADARAFFGKQSESYAQTTPAKISLDLSLAHLYKEEGNIPKALELFTRLYEQFPYTPYAEYIRFQKGLCLLSLKNVRAALLEFAALRQERPDSSYTKTYLFYVGAYYYDQGEFDAAADSLQTFLGQSDLAVPLRQKASRMLLEILFAQQKYGEAIAFSEQVQQEDWAAADASFRDTVMYIRSMALKEAGRSEESLPLWKALMRGALSAQLRSSVFVSIGDFFFERKKDFSQALFYFSKLVNEYPYSPLRYEVRLRMAYCFAQLRRYPEAAQAVNTVIAEATDKRLVKESLALLAALYEQTEAFSQADAAYAQLIERFPEERALAWFKRGTLAFGQRDYEKALAGWQEAESAGYRTDELRYYQALAAESLGRYEESVYHLTDLTEQYAESPFAGKAFVRLGRLYEKKNSPESALRMYRQALASGTDEPEFVKEKIAQLTR